MTEAKPAEPAPVKEEPEVGQMKGGDYLIHVFVENARQLKCPEGQTVDPLVEVTVLNEKKYTTAKDDIGGTGLCTWNEHLFFEPKGLTVEQVEGAKIQIKVLDKGYFKDAMIGCYDFDIAYVYFMKEHSLMHRWVALSNPQSASFNEVSGYLKISISIAATGDKQMQITEDTGADKSDEAVLMPPSIRPEYYQVKFRFFRAEHLPAMDKNILGRAGSIDAYITCNYLNHKLTTDVITAKEGQAVNWNTEFWIPCQMPIMSSRIVMKLFDQDQINDEIVGSLLFNLKDCINERNGKFFWKNIYGSPLGVSGANTDMMNNNPDLGSTWKGRVLMQVVAEKTEKPVSIKKCIPPEVIEQAQSYMQPKEYEIIAEIGQAISLPVQDKYCVWIRIGDYLMKTDKAMVGENTYNRWNTRFKQATYKAPYTDVYDMGRVYIYLVQGDKPISYFKADVEQFMDPNPRWQWFELMPDLSIGKIKDHYRAGIISLKLSIHDKSRNGPINFEQFDAWKKPPPKRLNVQKVRCFIFQCRDLPSADSDGQTDPYIKVWDTTKDIKKTQCIEDNNNPMFYETVELLIETATIQDMPPFVLDIFDKDTMSDEFVTRCLIPLKDAKYSLNDDVPEPKWHQCRIKQNGQPQGEVLVAFSIVESDYSYKIPMSHLRLQDQVDTQEFNIDINILGLRDLQSVGILPVKKAFIVFNLKSLVAPDDGRALENIKTQPNSPGPNPTINTLISFRLALPKAPLFCPRLVCTVHDYIFKGMSQPMIGSFTIPIGDLMHKLAEERTVETQAIEDILIEIDKIMKEQAVASYSINNISSNFDGGFGDIADNTTQNSPNNKLIEKAKSSIKVDDEMKKPLLSEQNEEEEKEFKQGVTPRVTPKSLMQNQARRKTIGNPMKIENFDKFQSGMKTQLLQEQKENEEKAKRDLDDQRQRELEELKRSQGASAVKNLLMPQYTLDTRLNVHRESDCPPDSLFIGLGWDENPDTKRRHYRRFYNQELETVKEIMPVETPFESFEIKKGQSRGAAKSWWQIGTTTKMDEDGNVSSEQVVGKFKGVVTVQSEKDKKVYQEKKADLIHNLKVKLNSLSLKRMNRPLEFNLDKLDTHEGRQKMEMELEKLGVSHLKITKHLADLESDVILNRLLLAQTRCIVRVYMIDAFNLSSRDNGSESDPYLILSCGSGLTYNERSNYQLDEPNPKFHKHYDFEGTFPGCAPLEIKVMDFDDIFGDDLIGQTTIDLEDRFFSPEWQSIKQKPIEYRNIYHPSTAISQGTVRLWVEIHPVAVPQNEIPIWNITPKPPEQFEVRLAIFDTVDVVAMDFEGTSDVYCRAFFDSKQDAKETDTHYRCQNGKASFNYRLLFDVAHPRKDYALSIQLYDRDFFKSNDIIGDCTLDLKACFEDASLSGRPLGLNKTYYNAYLKDKGLNLEFKDETSFWIPVKSFGKDGKIVQNGKVRVQIDIFPKQMAENNKVGEARQEPNHSPFLPPPVGRIQFDLNPLKMFNQLVGPELRRKVYMFCVCFLCLALCISLFPLIAGNLFSAIIENMVGLR